MGHHMDNLLKSFIRDETGAAAAEYALILAIIGAGVAVATTDLGAAISSAFTTTQGYF
jgi:pilus assembly protein Flp/PilA